MILETQLLKRFLAYTVFAMMMLSVLFVTPAQLDPNQPALQTPITNNKTFPNDSYILLSHTQPFILPVEPDVIMSVNHNDLRIEDWQTIQQAELTFAILLEQPAKGAQQLFDQMIDDELLWQQAQLVQVYLTPQESEQRLQRWLAQENRTIDQLAQVLHDVGLHTEQFNQFFLRQQTIQQYLQQQQITSLDQVDALRAMLRAQSQIEQGPAFGVSS